MFDPMPAINSILFPQEFDCCQPVRVLVWKIISKDPDEYEDHTGALISETENEYTIHEDGHMLPTFYPKRTPNGVTLYRMQTIRTTRKTST
jgi:hypothetical protein